MRGGAAGGGGRRRGWSMTQLVFALGAFLFGIFAGLRLQGPSISSVGAGAVPAIDSHKILVDAIAHHKAAEAANAVQDARRPSKPTAARAEPKLPKVDTSVVQKDSGHDAHPEEHAQHAERRPQHPNAVEGGAPKKTPFTSGRKHANGVDEIVCPAYDADIDNLQIPLKHLPRKKKTSVAQKYDRRAHNCVSHGIWNRVQIEDHRDILAGMVRMGKIKKGAQVFDWGCGCGHSLKFMSERHKVYGFGIDVSNKTIEYAQQNITDHQFCVADGTKLQWIPTSYFDNSISFGSVYHVYNRTKFCHVLRQMVRLTKVKGTVYNGWTENAEFKRVHIPMCFVDLPVSIKIHEEKEVFSHVKVFPLKSQQDVPNTYSLVVTKEGEVPDAQYDTLPIVCDTHRCEYTPESGHSGEGEGATGKKKTADKPLATPQPTTAQPEEKADNEAEKEEGDGKHDAKKQAGDEEGTASNDMPTCPPYDPSIDALQIPLKHLPRKKKTSVAQKYDRRADGCLKDGIWHKITIKDHRNILKKIAALLGVKRGDKVFDWGSGCGHKLAFLNKEHGVVGMGVDVSNRTVAYANANTTKSNRFCVADGTRLDWIPSNFFDHSFSFGSVYHVYNKTLFCSVLKQMVRITKVGGKVYNGWTENSEFPRKSIAQCLGDDDKAEVLEEREIFSRVENFPLKQYQKVPNTYSLLITKKKKSEAVDESS